MNSKLKTKKQIKQVLNHFKTKNFSETFRKLKNVFHFFNETKKILWKFYGNFQKTLSQKIQKFRHENLIMGLKLIRIT